MAYKTFVNGFVLNASELNTYLMNQSVMVFPNSAARTSDLPTPTEGMLTYIENIASYQYWSGADWLDLVAAPTSLSNVLITAPRETTRIEADATSGTEQLSVLSGSHMYHTSNAAGNFTLNVRGSGATTLNSLMNVGETATVAFSVTNGSSAFFLTALTIDGNAQTVKWSGGTAPTAGNANSIDVYSFAITKTGSATFMVLGTQTRFA
jgi:hypothetical protein